MCGLLPSVHYLLTHQLIIQHPWLCGLDPPAAHQTHLHGNRGVTSHKRTPVEAGTL